MSKIILLTGATDGIGLETAKLLVTQGHTLLIHGRTPAKLAAVEQTLSAIPQAVTVESYVADLANLADVEAMAKVISAKHKKLDVLLNNAGVYNAPNPITQDELDVRFVVNTIAPYLLTQQLLPLMDSDGRVINLSSAAQAPVNLEALAGRIKLSAGAAYAQSKLALTMWSRSLALALGKDGPAIVAVNPASLLGSKMVKEAFGVAGGDLRIGADILIRAALSEEFATASGKYFDNDSGQFASPHPDALNKQKCEAVVQAIEAIIQRLS